MHRDETAAKLSHLRPADGGLEPLAVMKRRVPVVDGRMVAAEGHFQVVALSKANDGSLDFGIEAGRGRATGASVRSGREAEFTKETHSGSEQHAPVQRAGGPL